MKMSCILLFITFNCCAYSQTYSGTDIFDESKITSWNTTDKQSYTGAYYFGFSEGESQLTITISKGIVCAQLSYYDAEIYEDGEFMGWRKTYKNYTHVKILDNKFYSDQSNGEFVNYISDEGSVKGLKLFEAPFKYDGDKYEIGKKGELKLTDIFSGSFPNATYEIIHELDLAQLTPTELQLMRNEIYARYGYTFREGGKMETHFKQQSWYRPTETNVDDWLTSIEKINIENIQRIEGR